MMSLMKCKYILGILLLGFLHTTSWAQIGGDDTYAFLDLPPSARVLSLGGIQNAIYDDDVLMSMSNPALLNEDMHSSIGLSHSFYHAGIGHGSLVYAHSLDSTMMLMFGLNYVDYGEFFGYDDIGVSTSTFSAGELAPFIGISRKIYDKLSLGASMKFVSSSLDSYKSSGLSFDLGAIYHNEEKRLSLALVVKNAGFQLSAYNDTKETLPLDVQIGLTRRLNHLPFRFGVVVHHLNRWNLRYDDPNAEEVGVLFEDETSQSGISGISNLFRHMTFSGEALFGQNENFNIRVAYNVQRRQELNQSTFRNLSGFSAGFGFQVNRFNIDYGLGIYHIGGTAHQLSIATNIQRFSRDRDM